MKKDLNKILSRTLITYFMILIVVFLLKIGGLDYFGIDTNNKIILSLDKFIHYWRLENIWYGITLYINVYVVMSITSNDNTKQMKKYTLLCMPLCWLIQYLKGVYSKNPIFVIIDFLYIFILSLCYIKFVRKEKIHRYNIGNYFLVTITSIVFQAISLITRNLQLNTIYSFVIVVIISLDYIILSLMLYELYFMKGGKSLCQMVHYSFSDLLISLKKLPKKLLKSYHNLKPKQNEKESILVYRIYLVLFWLYNFFTLFVIFFIATLNDTFIECIFIVSSFWINKGAFGKPFHLKRASTCFVVSSLSYYILNRLTWNIGISFLIPIILGIALSYLTSKLMDRQDNVYLYRGISSDDFYNVISKVTNNKEHIDICKDFYVDKKSNLYIANKYHYSEINVKKIKAKINKMIKELNN